MVCFCQREDSVCESVAKSVPPSEQLDSTDTVPLSPVSDSTAINGQISEQLQPIEDTDIHTSLSSCECADVCVQAE